MAVQPTFGAQPSLGPQSRNGNDRAIGDVVKDISVHTQQLIRGEVELAKTELTEKARVSGKYIAMGAAAAVLGVTAVFFLGITIAQLFVLAGVAVWLSYLITTLIFAGVAGGLAVAARDGISEMDMTPTETIKQVKEDLSWVKTHSR